MTPSDVDLDTEVVRLKGGRRLTNELAEQLAEETLAQARWRNLVPGRKSLSGGGSIPHGCSSGLPESLRSAAEKRTAEEGVSFSVPACEALEQRQPRTATAGHHHCRCPTQRFPGPAAILAELPLCEGARGEPTDRATGRRHGAADRSHRRYAVAYHDPASGGELNALPSWRSTRVTFPSGRRERSSGIWRSHSGRGGRVDRRTGLMNRSTASS